MPLHIESREERSITVFCLAGEIFNHDGASELRQTLTECMKGGQNRIVLEVEGIAGIDEAGVGTLQELQEEAKRTGGDLKITGARYAFLAAMALHGSGSGFPYYVDSEQAESSFAEIAGNGSKSVKRFDILEFVKEQEKEDEEAAANAKTAADSDKESSNG